MKLYIEDKYEYEDEKGKVIRGLTRPICLIIFPYLLSFQKLKDLGDFNVVEDLKDKVSKRYSMCP